MAVQALLLPFFPLNLEPAYVRQQAESLHDLFGCYLLFLDESVRLSEYFFDLGTIGCGIARLYFSKNQLYLFGRFGFLLLLENRSLASYEPFQIYAFKSQSE